MAEAVAEAVEADGWWANGKTGGTKNETVRSTVELGDKELFGHPKIVP